MRNDYLKITKAVALAIIILCLNACSNDTDLNNLSETIYVRHKNADMPAYIKGNASEKVFLITLDGGPGGFGLGFVGTAFSKIEENYGVVYFDQRGSGMSQGSYANEDISLDLLVEDVLALVRVMKLKYGNDSRYFLLGHSWGGTLGTATLLKDQSDFSGWIEVDGANNPSGLYDQYIETFTTTANTQIALGNSLEFWEWVLTSVAEVDPISNKDDFFKLNSMSFELEATLQKDNFLNNRDNGSESDGIIFQYNLLTAFWNLSQIQNILVDEKCLFQSLDFTNQLPEIIVPSLFISGEYDMVVPAVSAQRAFDNIGSDIKELRIFERSGHSPIASEPERFAEEVLQFINENK